MVLRARRKLGSETACLVHFDPSPQQIQRVYNAAKVVSHQQQQKRRHSRGAAPGIEPGWLIEAGGAVASDGTHCEISLIDYNHGKITDCCPIADSISAVVLNPLSLEEALKLPRPSHSSVRWINVKVHPLAVEDVMHPPQRMKADFYWQLIYVSMIVPLLKQHAKVHRTLATNSAQSEQLPRPDASLDECSIFLLPGNMVLSMFECSGRHITDKICEILHGSPSTHPQATPPLSTTQFSGSKHKAQPLSTALADIKRTNNPSRLTQLRKLGDASLLVHALVDGIVDSYFEFHFFSKSALYLMQKEIALIQRKLLPTESLIMHLRDADPLRSSGSSTRMSKLYFRDVLDHCMTVLEELSAIDTTAFGLIDLTFNTISFQTNESMKLLPVMSAIFLPITFVAGYFGMNFTYFPELSNEIVYATWRMGLLKKWD
ncbi:cora-like Mg2+ transporter protein-domain-containing protein [Chytriomyces cf. hyalinus JEL632]|nr:cora-like Mg2+ transporter protein-domain-containing protein [Chytriomyces cf. hyalinus JEL632]